MLAIGGIMAKTTPQPNPPWQREGKWFFTCYFLDGPKEIGPYPDEESARSDFNRAVWQHQKNGYTDSNLRTIDRIGPVQIVDPL
jgi:hypothetical protein